MGERTDGGKDRLVGQTTAAVFLLSALSSHRFMIRTGYDTTKAYQTKPATSAVRCRGFEVVGEPDGRNDRLGAPHRRTRRRTSGPR